MNLDFVKTPFTNNPSMVRHEGMAYNLKPNQEYLEQKKKELKLHKDSLNGEEIIELILDENQDNFVEAISVVEYPAIEEDFVALK